MVAQFIELFLGRRPFVLKSRQFLFDPGPGIRPGFFCFRHQLVKLLIPFLELGFEFSLILDYQGFFP